MPETDVLNPTPIWQSDIQDSMCPNYGYGFTRKRASTQLHKKAVGGSPWTRETQNTGHVFTFSWLGRSEACVERLKWYYEQYEDGYFTIIDQDGGGREYVGRFTSEVVPVETGNNLYDVQNVTFEEMPSVPMRNYPSDWDHDSILFSVNSDRGDQKLATSGAWTFANLSAAPAVTLGGIARGAATTYPLQLAVMNNPGNAGEWACYEYRGYGFKLWLRQGPTYGKADVYLDGVLLTTIDCYAAADLGPQIVLTRQSVSLDIHRVKIICDGTQNASATDKKITWWALQVMR
jgi:hypothetical protein